MKIKIDGFYQHFKGNIYTVLAMAKHSETLEELVIYQDISDKQQVWARPKTHFESIVVKNGQEVQRFKEIDANKVIHK